MTDGDGLQSLRLLRLARGYAVGSESEPYDTVVIGGGKHVQECSYLSTSDVCLTKDPVVTSPL
jgi:hypothetical protein